VDKAAAEDEKKYILQREGDIFVPFSYDILL
jgi:hypothetical protein